MSLFGRIITFIDLVYQQDFESETLTTKYDAWK